MGTTLLARAGPVSIAVALALISVVPVAWSLQIAPSPGSLANEGTVTPPIDWHPMGTIAALQLALVSVLPAALLGGLIGGYIWRWFRVSGAFAALSVAWATGIIVLPIAASLPDIPLRTGIACFFSCEANLRDDQPFSGVEAYGSLLVGSIWFAFFTPLTIAFAVLARRWGSLLLAVFGAVMTHGLIHAWALVSKGALVPYVSLAIGVILWSVWMGARDSRRVAAQLALLIKDDPLTR